MLGSCGMRTNKIRVLQRPSFFIKGFLGGVYTELAKFARNDKRISIDRLVEIL